MPARKNPTRDFYNKHAKEWAAQKTDAFYNEPEFRKFIQYFRTGAKILDIGCANGLQVPLFVGIGNKLRYEGLDVSHALLKIARRRYPEHSFLEADIQEKHSLPHKKYDGFWAASVLMHVPLSEWPQMMENVEAIMHRGAVGYITLPQKRISRRKNDVRHFTLFTPTQFKTAISKRRWKILKKGLKLKTERSMWNWFIVKLP